MKRRLFRTVLMVTMLAMTACSVDWEDILNDKNLMDNVEVVQLSWEETQVHNPTYGEDHRDFAIYACYEEKSDLGDQYAIDEAKLQNWKNRTLVIAHVYYHAGLNQFSTNVYEKDGKYIIEILEKGIEYNGGIFRTMAFDKCAFAILLDKPGVRPKDIKLKAGILENYPDGTRYHVFLETRKYP